GSASGCRQECADAPREIGLWCAVGCLCGLIYLGAPPQLVERQGRVHPPRVVEVAVDQPVEEMADVEPPLPPGGVHVTNDVDGAAVGEQVVELRPVGEFVDPCQIHKQQPPHVRGRAIEAIEVYRLAAVNRAYAHDVTFLAHHIDQFELLEHGGD